MARLLVVATPIGNLSDLTPRMREALESADLIAAEDTRVTMKLLNRMEIKKPMVSCHRHNEDIRAPQLVARMLAEDLTVALTCDAGTPAVSDPGHLLVRAAWEAGIPVTPVCGPSAVTTALSAAGFDAREFVFYGFLPREKKALGEKLDDVRASGVPVAVFYESPHRVVALVESIAVRGRAACWRYAPIFPRNLNGCCAARRRMCSRNSRPIRTLKRASIALWLTFPPCRFRKRLKAPLAAP